MFEETIGRVLTDHVTPQMVVAAEAGTWPAGLWKAIEDNGLGIAAAPEKLGGVGAGWHDAFGLVSATGRYAVPVPLAETILANWLLGLAGIKAVTGPVTVGVAQGSSSFDGRFSGCLLDVPWGETSDHVLTVASGSLILLRAADARCVRSLNLAREPRDDLHFDGAEAVAGRLLHESGLTDDAILLGGAMIRSAQVAGALQSLASVAVDHAEDRVQFGRPIGKFQSIQHQIAVLAEHAAMVSAASEAAFAIADEVPSFLAVAAAKSVASEAAGLGASIAHAVLGAMGFTYEHPLHFTTRRLWSWRSEFGSQTYWAQRLGSSVCAAGANGLWPSLTKQRLDN